jgi:hypothetical protein
LVPQAFIFSNYIIPYNANMSTYDETRLAAPEDSDPPRAKFIYYMYHNVRVLRDGWAQRGYDLSRYLEYLYEQPVVQYAEFCVLVLPAEIWFHRVVEERDECSRAMEWLAAEYHRVLIDQRKRNMSSCLNWHEMTALSLTLMVLVEDLLR